MKRVRMTVEPGNGSDICGRCGIRRENAGFAKESCGDGLGKPGCFVQPAEPEPQTEPRS